MNIKTKIGAVALTAALAIGGTTAAFAGGDSGTSTPTTVSTTATTATTSGSSTTPPSNSTKEARIAKLCENKDTILAKLTERQTNLTARLAKLQAAEKTATDAGNTKRADLINARIATVQDRLDKVTAHIAKAPAAIAKFCS